MHVIVNEMKQSMGVSITVHKTVDLSDPEKLPLRTEFFLVAILILHEFAIKVNQSNGVALL